MATKTKKKKTDLPADDTAEMVWYEVLKGFDGPDGEKFEPEDLVELKSTERVKSYVDLGYLQESEKDPDEIATERVRKSIRDALRDAIREELPAAFENLKGDESKKGIAGTIEVGADQKLVDPLLGWKSMGHYFAGVMDHAVRTRGGQPASERMTDYVDRIKKVNELSRKAAPDSKAWGGQDEAIGDEGAILAPAEISNQIHKRVFNPVGLLGQVDRFSVRGNAITFPQARDDNRASGGNRHGGVNAAWVSAGETLTIQKVAGLKQVALKLAKLSVLVAITSEMQEDSGGLVEQWVLKNVADEIEFQVSLAIWEGSGNGKPLGFMDANSGVLLSLARDVATKIGFEDVKAMASHMWAPSLQKAQWFVHQRVPWEHLLGMSIPVKNVAGTENVGGLPVYMPPGGLTGQPNGVLFGRPVVPLEFCQPPGTAGDIVLADMGEYVVITKGGAGDVPAVDTAMSIHFYFDMDATAFRTTYRIDGRPWQNKLLTPFREDAGIKHATFIGLTT